MKMLIVLFGAAGGVAATISVGAGVAAAAPDVVGQTYNDAKQTIQETGAAVIIATRTGAGGDREMHRHECVGQAEVSSRQATPPDTVWVALNCNAAVASAGSPGNSAASTAGRQALIAQDAG